MPYKTGYWGEQAKERSKRRKEYFRERYNMRGHVPKIFRLGEFGELLAQRKMNGSKLTNQTSHDLLWNGQKIEVKTSQQEGSKHQFDISIQKREGKTDFFFILILDERTRELRNAYLIPAKAITAQSSLTITPGQSKYERFRLELKPGGGHGK